MTLSSRPLFRLELEVPPLLDLGTTPYGHRRIATVSGGRFQGDRLRGTVVPTPAGDWLLQRSDGVLMLDVRLVLQTDDGGLVYMSYRGLRHGPADVMARVSRGEPVDPSSYYFRVSAQFETSSPAHAWLNGILAIGMGQRQPAGPVYEVHEVL